MYTRGGRPMFIVGPEGELSRGTHEVWQATRPTSSSEQDTHMTTNVD